MTRAEAVLMTAASVVLIGGIVGAVTVDGDDKDEPSAVPSTSPTTAPVSPSSAPTPTPRPVTPKGPQVSAIRTTSYARGSHQIVVTAHVTGAMAAALHAGERTIPLRLVGSTVSGTVPVDCTGAVPTWTLDLTSKDGTVTSQAMPAPTTAFAQACASPQQSGPVPSSTRGS